MNGTRTFQADPNTDLTKTKQMKASHS